MLITQISHIQEVCQSEKALRCQDPYMKQALTAYDHSARSRVVGFLTGGLNTQSIHHVLPSISLCHYPALYPKFREICLKHDCLPAESSHMHQAVASHLAYVYSLGKDGVVGVTATEEAMGQRKPGPGMRIGSTLAL